MWFKKKGFKIIIDNPDLSDLIRSPYSSIEEIIICLFELYHNPKFILENRTPYLNLATKIYEFGYNSKEKLKETGILHLPIKKIQNPKISYLIRGINRGELENFLKTGNSRTYDSISEAEKTKYDMEIDLSKTIYASTNANKAKEYTFKNKHLGIFIFHKKEYFEKINEIDGVESLYCYKLKESLNFSDSIEFYIIFILN